MPDIQTQNIDHHLYHKETKAIEYLWKKNKKNPKMEDDILKVWNDLMNKYHKPKDEIAKRQAIIKDQNIDL